MNAKLNALKNIIELEKDGVKLNRHNRRKKLKLARELRVDANNPFVTNR